MALDRHSGREISQQSRHSVYRLASRSGGRNPAPAHTCRPGFSSHLAGSVQGMDWTPAQQEVLEHRGGWLDVRGAAATGKTSVLVERWRRAAAAGHADRVLVLCPSRDGADRFRRSALGDRWWAGEDLPFTTHFGAAFDLVRRHRGDRRLLTRGAVERRPAGAGRGPAGPLAQLPRVRQAGRVCRRSGGWCFGGGGIGGRRRLGAVPGLGHGRR